MLELRLIRHALALGRARNFAHAADTLNLTQPTLSRSIAALEEALGVRLFDRDSKHVEPTAFGRILLARGEALLGNEAELRREIQLLAGLEAGRLTIGAGPYAGEGSVARAVARLISAHPRLRVELLTLGPEQVVAGVLVGRFDVGVADLGGVGDESRLCVERLTSHPIYLACRPGHPLTRSSGLTLERVLAFPLVSTVLRGDVATTASTGGALGNTDPDSGDFMPAISVNSFAIARCILRDSDAVFPGTRSMLAADLESGHLVLLDFRVPVMRTGYSLMYLRGRSVSPAARAFMDAFRAVEAEITADDERLGAPAAHRPDERGRAKASKQRGRRPARPLPRKTRRA